MNGKKNLLMILNYFYPEVASTGQLMTDLAKYLQQDYNITVIANIPSYSSTEENSRYKGKRFYYDKVENINVIRVHVPKVNKKSKVSRIYYILTYFINAFLAAFKVSKPDVVYTISQPPILGGLLGYLTKLFRGGKLVYNIQDFNPEQSEAIGYTNSLINKAAKALDNHTCNHSDAIVVVGRDMRQTMLKRNKNVTAEKVHVINNWADESELYPLDFENEKVKKFRQKHGLENKLVIMYSGNIGLYYDLENIIKVIGRFKDNDDVRFVFIGEGAMKQTLTDFVKNHNINNVVFLPYQPKDEIIYSLNSADIHFVTNQKGIKGVSVPSKLYGIMAVGKAVLGILEEGSEAQLLIQNSNCGKSVEPQDYNKIESLIQEYINMDKKVIQSLGLNGRKYLEENLTMGLSLKKYNDVIEKLVQ